jgi:hypothetical protein
MGDLLSKLNGGQLLLLVAAVIALVGVLGGLLTGVIAILATQRRWLRVTEAETALKQQLLEKGMSAAEIEQVIKASSQPGTSDECPSRLPTQHSPLAHQQPRHLDY